MEHNRKQIIKALECCIKAVSLYDCEKMGCPAFTKSGCRFYLRTDEESNNAIYVELIKDALSLIKELTEENEKLTINMNAFGLTAKRLGEENERLKDTLKLYHKYNPALKAARADAVRKVVDLIEEKALAVPMMHKPLKFILQITKDDLDQIAKEMTESAK